MRAWYVLLLVSLAQVLSLADRQILAILAPRIREDLGVGNAEMGLLYGTLFGLFYAVFTLPLGYLADNWVRTRLLSLCIAAWSTMTLLTGFAAGYAQLALARFGLGIGEAGAQPAGMSLLSDVFPKSRRGMIGAAMGASVALGLGGALWLGGSVADYWDARRAAGVVTWGMKGWQVAFVCAAIPGFVVALLLLALREPVRGALDGQVTQSSPTPRRALSGAAMTLAAVLPIVSGIVLARAGASRRLLWLHAACVLAIVLLCALLHAMLGGLRPNAPVLFVVAGIKVDANLLQWTTFGLGLHAMTSWLQSLFVTDREAFGEIAGQRAMQLLFAIIALQMIINYGVMSWTATLLIKGYGQSAASVGMKLGLIIVTTGVAGPIIAGIASDWLERRRQSGGLLVLFGALLVSPALMYAVFTSRDATTFYLWFMVYSLLLTMWAPPMFAALMNLVLPRLRGVTMSLYVLVTTVFGLGLGPYLVGLLSDVRGGDLGGAILWLLVLCPVVVGLAGALVWGRHRKSAADRMVGK